MTTDLTLDSVDLSTAVPAAKVIRVSRPLVGRRRDQFVDVPGRAGSWVFPADPSDRTLTIDLSVADGTFAERRAAVRDLADWCDLGKVAPLVLDDEPDRYHDAILSNDPDPAEWLLHASPTLAFNVGPYALDLDVSAETLAVAGAGSDSGTFAIDDTIPAEPVLELTATNGTVASFALTLGDDTLSYEGPLIPSGNAVTINTLSDTVTAGINTDTMVTGAYNPAALIMALVAGVFPLLQPGNNDWSLTWTGTATELSVEITWRRRYR